MTFALEIHLSYTLYATQKLPHQKARWRNKAANSQNINNSWQCKEKVQVSLWNIIPKCKTAKGSSQRTRFANFPVTRMCNFVSTGTYTLFFNKNTEYYSKATL